jgi:hypothetical protein
MLKNKVTYFNNMSQEPVDYLKADDLKVSGQNYALISVVSPSSNQKNDMCGVKIKGVFETVEEAKMHAKRVQENDPLFDVYLVELYKWLPVPPNNEMIENQEYQDEELNKIIKARAEDQRKAHHFFEERKKELMEGKVEPMAAVHEEDVERIKISEGEEVEEP